MEIHDFFVDAMGSHGIKMFYFLFGSVPSNQIFVFPWIFKSTYAFVVVLGAAVVDQSINSFVLSKVLD